MNVRLKTPEAPPLATRIESICSAHGEQWVDHYAWLKADNWQEVIEDPAKLPAPIANLTTLFSSMSRRMIRTKVGLYPSVI